jgi:hypothetical protein
MTSAKNLPYLVPLGTSDLNTNFPGLLKKIPTSKDFQGNPNIQGVLKDSLNLEPAMIQIPKWI